MRPIHALSFEEQQWKVVFCSSSPEAVAAERDTRRSVQSQFNLSKQRLGCGRVELLSISTKLLEGQEHYDWETTTCVR